MRRPWTGALLSLVLIAAIAVLAGWQVHWPPAVFGSRNTGQHRPAAGPSSSGPAVPAPAGTTAAGAPSGDIPSGDTPSGDTPSASTESAQQEAAASLAGLLQQSASDRSAVNDAYNDVLRCGPNGAHDVQVFQQAVTSRQQLLSQLQDLPSQSALPQSMLQDLSAAWQASATADADYVAWAQDQSAGGCVPNSTGDPHYQAAIGPNQQATADKTSFAILWNQLASQYGYARYQQNDF